MSDDELLERIQQATLELPGSRKSVADFLLREGSGVAQLSMAEVADLTFTSKPSLVRFAKAMGFVGWKDFRLAFVKAMSARESSVSNQELVDPNHPFASDDSLQDMLSSVCTLETQALLDAKEQLDVEALSLAAARVLAARNLVFFGAAPNCYFGELFAFKLSTIAISCHVPPYEEWEMMANGLGKHDCAIIASYSGNGPQRKPVSLVPALQKSQVPTIAITNSGSNYLRDNSDCVLSFVPRERYFSKITGYYSEQCVRLILDALFSAVFLAHYDRNEVLRLHSLIDYERKCQHPIVDVLPY